MWHRDGLGSRKRDKRQVSYVQASPGFWTENRDLPVHMALYVFWSHIYITGKKVKAYKTSE